MIQFDQPGRSFRRRLGAIFDEVASNLKIHA